MDSILKQLPLETETDVLGVHHFLLQLAERAGLSIPEYLNFSGRVTQHCLQAFGPDEKIIFSQHPFENRFLLRAYTTRKQGRILVECTQSLTKEHFNIETASPISSLNTGAIASAETDPQLFNLALAHELKNSIAKIKLAVTLAGQEPLTESVKNYVAVIHRATSQLESTLAGLSELVKFGHGEKMVATILPSALFHDVHQDFIDAVGKGGRIEVNFAPVGEIRYIPVYLQTIFSNMISNAINYAAEGRPLRFQAKAIRQEPFVVFSFTDNGRGIDLEKFADRLFQPFTRFSTDKKGAGIGLYLVKKMTEHNGGKVEVESTPGEGTTFHFYLREY